MCSTNQRRLIQQAFRFELEPNRGQRVLLAKSVGASRYVYNWGLAESQRAYEMTGRRPRLSELKSQLVQLKKGECPWLYEVSAHIGQQALVDLDRAFGRVFNDVVGVDLGLRAFAMIDDGESSRTVEPPRALRTNLAKLRRLDRRLARKERGSRNREKARVRRARLHYKISCKRHDLLHHVSSKLAKTKSVIVLENLNVKGMQENRSLALSVSDAGHRELRRQLAYKCDWYGSRLIVVDRFFPSTQLCSGCGVLSAKVKGVEGLKQRRFVCEACGLSLDRDENAAINIRRAGLGELGIDLLPEGLREVTPDGEEGAGRGNSAVKPASRKQEAKARRNSGETRRSTRQLVEVPADVRTNRSESKPHPRNRYLTEHV